MRRRGTGSSRHEPTPMKVALVYNAQANRCRLDAKDIGAQLARAGHEIVRASADGDWDQLRAQGIQAVLVAGGDGTVEAVLPHLIGAPTPFCVLPCGTANNIAKSLNQMHSLPELASGLAGGRALALDVGLVGSASGQRYFVEAVGAGLFVDLLKRLQRPEVRAGLEPVGPPDQKLARLREYLKRLAAGLEGFDCRLRVDGEGVSGRFLLAEVMNMKLIGPNLALAPWSDPGDGWFDLVLVREDQREELLGCLERLQRGQILGLPFERRPCRAVAFERLPPAIHVDDALWEPAPTPTRVRIQPGALQYLRL